MIANMSVSTPVSIQSILNIKNTQADTPDFEKRVIPVQMVNWSNSTSEVVHLEFLFRYITLALLNNAQIG